MSASISPFEIRYRRTRLGLTQTGFARIMGVTQAAVAQWERGKRNPDQAKQIIVTLRRLERAHASMVVAMIDTGAPVITYTDDETLWTEHPQWAGVPVIVHQNAAAEARAAIAEDGTPCEIVTVDALGNTL